MDWDNTARRGKKAIVVRGFTLEKFKLYFKRQFEKSCDENKEYLFFNAWNEWSEGTYLEPDEKNGYEYLKIIKEIVEMEKN